MSESRGLLQCSPLHGPHEPCPDERCGFQLNPAGLVGWQTSIPIHLAGLLSSAFMPGPDDTIH